MLAEPLRQEITQHTQLDIYEGGQAPQEQMFVLPILQALGYLMRDL